MLIHLKKLNVLFALELKILVLNYFYIFYSELKMDY